MNTTDPSNEHSISSDRAAARFVTAARVLSQRGSVRESRTRRQLDLASEQGAGQGQLAYVRIRTARNLATVLFLAGVA